ncbi:MAG: HAD family hydrolase [Dehalococcoidales bacterium]|nr:HAD family hydrolase [Dehalococcoidales bacterium]
MIKAIIFDLDGVIIESAGIKTEAFRALFSGYPDKLPQIMAHHEKNAGISRYVKFRYFYEKILGLELTPEREKELGEEFSRIVLDKILKAPLVDGVMKFLKNNAKRYLLYIASGTPEEELQYILKQRGLETFFRVAYGTPLTKTEITRRILAENNIAAGEAVFIGDAESDLIAARETGVTFVARTDMSDNTLKDCEWRIRDFTGFEAVLAKIEKTVPAST